MNRRRVGFWALVVLCLVEGRSRAVEPGSEARAGEGYRAALMRYAAGEPGRALAFLLGTESDLAKATGGDFERVRRLELRVLDGMSASGVDYLLPVIALHERAYLAYRERNEMPSALHARTMMYLLADLYGEGLTSDPQKWVAADLFASLGGYFQETTSGMAAMGLFEQALGFNGTNEAALMGVAVALEQQGRYRQALAYLERVPSENPEGRLRLGINLGRTESARRAIGELRELVDRQAPVWVTLVAYQECARLLIDDGQTEAARVVLSIGRERYPHDETLAIALAYLEERWGGGRGQAPPLRGQESGELLAALEGSAGASGRPPRFRYSRAPVGPLERARQRLSQREKDSLPLLTDALKSNVVGEGLAPSQTDAGGLKGRPYGSAEIRRGGACPLPIRTGGRKGRPYELRRWATVGEGLAPSRTPSQLRVSLTLTQDESIQVSITHPTSETPAFGEVDVTAEVSSAEPIGRVEFFLDGALVATDREPPYRARVEVGYDNVARQFTVIAYDASLGTGRSTVVTHEVTIDYQVELSLQQLYVTATREGETVVDLEQTDFTIFDDGTKQELITFERGGVPMTAVLLVDASESMKGNRLAAAMAAARELRVQLGALDEVMVVVFSDRTLSVTRFASGDAPPSEPVAVEAAGGTALNDHLYAALRLLDPRQGRPVVILLSDGADTLSFLRMEEVHWKLRRSDALVYRIRPEGSVEGQLAFANSWRGFQDNVTEVQGLERAIQESGGRVRTAAIDRLEEAIAEIVEELRQQYVLGYYPSEPRHDGGWRPLRVEVGIPGVEVRTRSGYVDD